MANRSYVWTYFRIALDADECARVVREHGGSDVVRYSIGQLERCPSSSRLHIQGYTELRNPMRVPGFKGTFGPGVREIVHVEPRRGTREQAREYCRKEDTRVSGPWETGEWTGGGSGRRTDLAALKVSIDDGADDVALWEGHFTHMLRYHKAVGTYRLLKAAALGSKQRDILCRVYYGRTGTGKSHRAFKEAACEVESFYVLPQGRGDIWFDGYIGQRGLIIDEFYGWIQWSLLLRILDKYPLQVPIKGGFVAASWTHIWITSNSCPDQWYDVSKVGTLEPLKRRLTKVEVMDVKYV